jgi:hypothetical protein
MPCNTFSADAESFFRLKLLKEEIKKPYFISLKKFLWEEGVHGPDESAKNLKVYPSRMFPFAKRSSQPNNRAP